MFYGELTVVKLRNIQYRISGNAFGNETPYITFALECGVYDQDYPLGEGILRICKVPILKIATTKQSLVFGGHIYQGAILRWVL